MNVCLNPECNKKVFEGVKYCTDCDRQLIEIKKETKTQGQQNNYSAFNPNEGT